MTGSDLIKSFLLILFVILKILFISADIHSNCCIKLFGIMGYNTVNLCLIFFCLINEWYFRYSFSGNSSAINKIAKLSRKRSWVAALTLLVVFWKAVVISGCPTNTSSQALSSYYTCAVACLSEADTHECLSDTRLTPALPDSGGNSHESNSRFSLARPN